MQDRQMKLLKSLLYSSAPRSLESLIEEWNVSERTIKYDISTIRKKLKEIEVKLLNKKGIGYYFLPSDKPIIIEEYSLPEDDNEKQTDQTNIILYTLFVQGKTNVKDIAEFLYYDISSVRRFIETIEPNQSRASIEMDKDGNLSIQGSEIAVRKFYSDLLIKKMKTVNGIEISLRLKKAFPFYESFIDEGWINKVEDNVKLLIHQHQIWISEAALEYLIVYLYVMRLRKDTTSFVESINDISSFKGEHQFAEKLLRQLNWGLTNENEIQLIVHIMIENNIFIESNLQIDKELELTEVIHNMLDTLKQAYPDDRYHEDELISDLTPHLKQIIRKTELGGSLKQNPLFHQVKLKYNKHYQIAQKIYKEFCRHFNIEYTDNEASLLAIYLYKNAVNDEQTEYYAYLVCGTGRGFSKLLETRLNNLFPNIVILERLSSLQLLKKQDISKADLIISTIDLPDKGTPVIKISSFLGRRDIQLINQVLEYGTASDGLSMIREESKELPSTPIQPALEMLQSHTLLKDHAVIFSNIILDLYSTMVNLPDSYNINQEKLLGISIHLIIALPRYFDGESMEEDAEIVEEVILIEKNHQVLAREMGAFLNRIEMTIGKGIPYMERYALYQYILN